MEGPVTRIRSVELSDAADIAGIYNPFIENSVATFEEKVVSASDVEIRINKILEAGFPYLVAETIKGLAGYAYASPWKSRAAYRHTVEVSIYIRPDYHGHGIGTELYEDLFGRLRDLNCHSVIGVITLPNEASVRLHESFGLTKAAHFPEVGRKFSRWIDVGYWHGFLRKSPP